MASYLTPLPLAEVFARDAAEVLANFVITYKSVKAVQTDDQEIKIVNFADDTTIFLGDIDILTRIQTILKLYKDTSSSKINLTKIQALWSGGYKNRCNKAGNMVCQLFYPNTWYKL